MAAKNIATEQTPLAVPYARRGEVKHLAGKLANGENALGWDKVNKIWFAKPGADLGPLKEFLSGNVTDPQAPTVTPRQELIETLEENGFIVFGDHPIFNGKWQRIPVSGDKAGQKSGAYRAFEDGTPAGHYQNYRKHGDAVKWVSTGQTMSEEEKAKLKAESVEKKARREAEQKRKFDHHAKRCQQLWGLLNPAKNNGYLKEKGVRQYDVRMDKRGNLVVPIRNMEGEIRTLQRIGQKSFKSLKKGAEKMGNFHLLNADKLDRSPVIFYNEGYSTAASIAEATNMPVVMSVDSGNLPRVAKQFAEKYRDKGHIISGDDDCFKEKNMGRVKAEEAAKVAGEFGRATFPNFGKDNPKQFTDFNDLHKSLGLDAVKNQLRPVVQNVMKEMRQKRQQQQDEQKMDRKERERA